MNHSSQLLNEIGNEDSISRHFSDKKPGASRDDVEGVPATQGFFELRINVQHGNTGSKA